MSLEQVDLNQENMQLVIKTNDPKAESFDPEGNPRVSNILLNGDVFYGSAKELSKRLAEEVEDFHNK
jgi:hypothetical protein